MNLRIGIKKYKSDGDKDKIINGYEDDEYKILPKSDLMPSLRFSEFINNFRLRSYCDKAEE